MLLDCITALLYPGLVGAHGVGSSGPGRGTTPRSHCTTPAWRWVCTASHWHQVHQLTNPEQDTPLPTSSDTIWGHTSALWVLWVCVEELALWGHLASSWARSIKQGKKNNKQKKNTPHFWDCCHWDEVRRGLRHSGGWCGSVHMLLGTIPSVPCLPRKQSSVP